MGRQHLISYYFNLATERSTFSRALKVSLVVGIILNLINHPQILKNLSFSGLSIMQIILTFFVPFAVSSYSSVMSQRKINQERTSNE